MSFFFFFFNSDQGGKLSKHECLLCKNLTRPRTHHQRMTPFPRPETEVQTEMMKNIGLCFRSASSRRAQGSGRTYPPPTLRRSGPEALTNPTAGSAMAVEQGLELHMILAKRPRSDHWAKRSSGRYFVLTRVECTFK